MHFVVSDLSLYCFTITVLGVSQLNWVKAPNITAAYDILKYKFIFSKKIRLDISYELYNLYEVFRYIFSQQKTPTDCCLQQILLVTLRLSSIFITYEYLA